MRSRAAKFVGIFCAFCAVLGLCAPASAAQPITLSQMLELATKSNPQLGVAAARVDVAAGVLREAASLLYPRVDASLGAAWLEDVPLWPAIDPLTRRTIAVVPAAFRNTYSAGLKLSQVLYAGGSLVVTRQAAQYGLDVVRTEQLRAWQSVRFGVCDAFYTLQRALAQRGVAEEGLSLSQEHLKQTQSMFDAGLVPLNDVLRLKVDVSNARMSLIRTESAIQVAWSVLESSVGKILPPNEYGFPVSGDLRTLFPARAPVSDDLQAVEAQAMAHRPELRATSRLYKQAMAVERAEKGAALPQVAFQAGLDSMDDSFFPRNDWEWSAAVRMDLRVWDAGEVSARVAQAKAVAREVLYRYDDLVLQIHQDVAVAEAQLRSAVSRFAVCEAQVRFAQEDYRIALRRYETQVGTNIDVLDARMGLIDSKSQYVDALYDIAIETERVLFAIGNTPSEVPPGMIAPIGPPKEAAVQKPE